MRKFLIVALVLVVVATGAYFAYKNKLWSKSGSETSGDQSGETATGSSTTGEPSDVFQEPVKYGSLKQNYDHSTFSFKYSDGFKVSSVVAGTNEEVVTIENEKGSGFQIFIMPWDEAGPITPERIWQDMPEADVLEPKNASLDGSETLVFYGYNGDLGETFEAWTVRNKKLYQITGPKVAEQLIVETLETWDWK